MSSKATRPIERKKRKVDVDDSAKSTNSNAGDSRTTELNKTKKDKLKRRNVISSDEEDGADQLYDSNEISAAQTESSNIARNRRKKSRKDEQLIELKGESSATKPKNMRKSGQAAKKTSTKAQRGQTSSDGDGEIGEDGRIALPSQGPAPPTSPTSDSINNRRIDESSISIEFVNPISDEVLREADRDAQVGDDCLTRRLQKLRLEIMVKESGVADAVAGSVLSLSKDEVNVIAQEENVDLHRNPKAMRTSPDGIATKLDQIVSKVRINCGFDDEGEDDEENVEDRNIDGQPRRRLVNEIGESIDGFGTFVKQASKITFKKATFTLARSRDDFESFIVMMKEKIKELAMENNRRQLMESYAEATIYRSIMSMHLWLVFCCTQSKNPDELSPDLLREFRNWLLKLNCNTNRTFVDRSRFNQSISTATVASNVVRVFIMYKLMGIVDVGTTLAKFMGDREEFVVWRRWMSRQAGDRTPMSRFVIGPEEIDYFGEQIQLETDGDFQSLLYLLTMFQTGARGASLLRKSGSTHVGLLIQDVVFKLLPDRRLSAEITITREKQTKNVLKSRVVPIEDRITGFSLPAMLFAQFVRLGVFANSVDDMLNVEKNIANRLFVYKDEFKETNVFRRTDETNRQLTPHALTIDAKIFQLFCRVMRLPRRGFSARSIRQGEAVTIIQPMVQQRGFFHSADVVEALKSSGIWDGRAALHYLDEFRKKTFNSTASLFGSEAVNPHGDTSVVRKNIPSGNFRLLETDYIADDNAQVTEMVKSLPEFRTLYAEAQTLENRLRTMFDEAGVRVDFSGSIIIRKGVRTKLLAAGLDADVATQLKDDICDLRQSTSRKLRDRVAQYADHLNYETFFERRKNQSCSRPMQITGLTFDWHSLAENLETFNKKADMWIYSPYRSADLIPSIGVECVFENCDLKFVDGSDLRFHMNSSHGAQFVHTARQGKRVIDQITSVQKDKMPKACGGRTRSSVERVACKSDNCVDVSRQKMSQLKTHFEEKHWAVYFCKTCERDFTASEYDDDEHEQHQVASINPNFQYRLYLLQPCAKCERYVESNKLPPVSCILTLEKVKSLFSSSAMDEYYLAYSIGARGNEANSTKDVLKAKREILYKLLKHRLYGVGESSMPLPSCVLKEVQRRFSHNSNDPGFQAVSQEK